MESPVVFVLILTTIAFSDHVRSQSITASQNPVAVGSNVTLSSTARVNTGTWIFNNNVIVFLFPGTNIITDSWRDRVTYNSTTSSLTLRSLTLDDSGIYTLQDVTSFSANLTLSVQVPISNVTLWAKETNLVEYNDTAVLMCSVSNGSSLSFKWLNGNSTVVAGGQVLLSNGNATLTILNVTRHYQGPITCEVSNGISQGVSGPVHLNISYGPSDTTIMITPMKHTYKTGSNIKLSCSAVSNPPAMIQWMVNGVYLNQSGPQLQLENVTEGNSGHYTCVFHNTVTSRFSSASAMIRVLAPITAVVVKPTSGPAVINESFTLQCEMTGSADTILWWMNDQPISADNSTVFGMNNKTLTLNPVRPSDNGHYKCQAFNSVSNMTSSPYTVDIIYGPEMPIITGPTTVKTGYNATLSCHASSNPPSHYKWYYNGSLVSNESEYTTPHLTKEMVRKYICMAFNNATGQNSSAYIMLTVVDPIENVQVEAPDYPAKGGNSYYLTCNVTGPADHVYWMKNGELLHEDNTTVFYMDNKTVKFIPVNHYDTGYYQCVAVNAVGNMTSPKHMLLVNFGPETPIIKGPDFAETGHYANFSCSAMSVPPSHYSWWHYGSMVADTSVYTVGPLSLNMTGEYTCKAYNNVTGKNSKKSANLTVIGAIESMMVQNSTIPISNKNFTLTCDVVGPYDKIYWMKDSMKLNMTNPHSSYHIEKNMLHFTPVTPWNDGTYQCVAANQAAQHMSPPYIMLVNYGPINVTISGPNSAELGATDVSLTCSADSQPECHFYWFFNNQSNPLANGSVITFSVTKESEGKYTCKARNPVTNITMYQSQIFTISAPITAVVVKPTSGPAMINESFTLQCEVTGSADTILWWMNGQPISADNSTVFGMNNKTLTLNPVQLLDNGHYKCQAFNSVSNMTSSPYTVDVIYGPVNVTISGPNSAELGATDVSLTCSADSQPECHFYWFFNNQSNPLANGSVITFSVTKESEGKYTCKARNPVTNITMYQSQIFTISDHASAIHFSSHGSLMLMGLFAFSTSVLFN